MKYLIIGAGPAGLSLAARLMKSGEDSFIVLEREGEAGGLCRSTTVNNAPFDFGGGHFLDVRNQRVNRFLFEFMPEEEWNIFVRNSKISLHNQFINHPIEANIWQMDIDLQVSYLKSIAAAGCNKGVEMPEKFVEWIYWKLGSQIADDYMIPYNRKMFSDDLNELGTYWLNKLPNVNFEEILLSCLQKKAYGRQPGHTKFYYPIKYGYGELWKRIGNELKKHVEYHKCVSSLDIVNKNVETTDGSKYKADTIITTIPWRAWKSITGLPYNISKNISKLKHSSIETRYFEGKIDSNAHWIYYPESGLPYHRILAAHNFCQKSVGYWTETRAERVDMFTEEEVGCKSFLSEYAYPLNTIGKETVMKELLEYVKPFRIHGLGRWGEHRHYNSDVVVELAINLADKIRV